ncbi:MAG: glycosyltransferase family 2 protein [Alphaproteobacteria bacterium]|nr:glycosyltransferase family 2 protein [Alphaproteobacteria bacterium]MBV9860779.1 glycosyltransferase family 2 protein [Alphaproteobacteria bacterium]
MEPSSLRIAVGIATMGRPKILRFAQEELARQSRPPERVLICAPTAGDIEGCNTGPDVALILGPRGLTRQRNAILSQVSEFDILVFFDDDFFPMPNYIAEIERLFQEQHDIVMATGLVIADGIIGPGLGIEAARDFLQRSPPPGGNPKQLREIENGYGCNMAVRLAAVRAGDCRFDERLPLYGWLEDVDFSRQLSRHGRIVQSVAVRGVHLGIKSGRQSGMRLGYSQIANPIYLLRKGTCPWPRALRLMSRNTAANFLRAFRPEPYIDRLGRLAGNFSAFGDLLAGRLDPERIMEL